MRTISSNQDLHSLDVNRDSKFLAAQVGAFFFAGIVFCIAAQAFYVYINIFRAYERPVLWAFLCSVPLRGLKLNVDQILAEAAEAADGEEKERRTPESNTGVAGGKRLKYLNILILAYILYGTMEKETWADLFVVLAYCFAGICVAWCAIFVVAFILQLLPPINACCSSIISFLYRSNPMVLAEVLYRLPRTIKDYFLTKVAKIRCLRNSIPSIVMLVIAVLLLFLSILSAIAIQMEFFNSVKAFQGKMNSFIPTIKPSMMMNPTMVASGHADSAVDRADVSDFSRLFHSDEESPVVLGESIHGGKPVVFSWAFDNHYVVEHMGVTFCPDMNVGDDAMWGWTHSVEGLVHEYSSHLSISSKASWKTLSFSNSEGAESNHQATLPASLKAMRVNIMPKGVGKGVHEVGDICIKSISISGFLDLQGTARKILNSSAKDYPIISQLAEAREMLFPAEKSSGEKASMDMVCKSDAGNGQFCHDPSKSEARKFCALSMKGRPCHRFFSNITFSNGRACVSEINRCIKTYSKSFASTNTSFPNFEKHVKDGLEEMTKGMLSVLGTVVGASVMLFNLLLDGIVFVNVLSILVYATVDPVGWVLISFTSFDEQLQGTLITYVQNYISGVFKVLLRIVFVNGMITWLTLDIAGISFSVTLGLLSGLISLFGDLFGNLAMVIPGLLDLYLRDEGVHGEPFKVLFLVLVSAWRFFSPESGVALNVHLIHIDDKNAEHSLGDNTSILTLVPWSIFGGVFAFGIGGAVIGPIVAILPFLAKDIFAVYRDYSKMKPEEQEQHLEKLKIVNESYNYNTFKSPEKKKRRRASIGVADRRSSYDEKLADADDKKGLSRKRVVVSKKQ